LYSCSNLSWQIINCVRQQYFRKVLSAFATEGSVLVLLYIILSNLVPLLFSISHGYYLFIHVCILVRGLLIPQSTLFAGPNHVMMEVSEHQNFFKWFLMCMSCSSDITIYCANGHAYLNRYGTLLELLVLSRHLTSLVLCLVSWVFYTLSITFLRSFEWKLAYSYSLHFSYSWVLILGMFCRKVYLLIYYDVVDCVTASIGCLLI
jgi:hypothetical protein